MVIFLPIGGPLTGESEAAAIAPPPRLDDAVGRPALDLESLPEPVDALRVQRIDRDPRPSGEPGEDAARREIDVVDGRVLRLEWLALVLLVHHESRHRVQRLVQRAAVSDVQFLEAPAP